MGRNRTYMRLETVSIDRIMLRTKDRLYALRHGSDWIEIIESLRKNPKNPNFQFVYNPVDVVCVSKMGNRAIYPDCYFSITDGRHRYYCLKSIGAKTIKVRFSFHDTQKNIDERRKYRKDFREWKNRKCLNCKFCKSLEKGRNIKVNGIEKLCFFKCKKTDKLMEMDDLFRLKNCDKFKEKPKSEGGENQ